MKSILRKKTKTLTKPISSKNRLMVANEKLHIQAHLALTELRLRLLCNVDNSKLNQRATILDTLHNYWKKGLFPKNTYEIKQRKPVFIDNKGTYCAVGYLMVNSGYGNLAKSIDSSNKFVLVEDLDDNRTKGWLIQNGLTQKEASLIQPGYGGFIIERVGYTIQDKILAVVTLVSYLLLVGFVIVALRLLRNRTITKPKKRNRLLQIATGSAIIIAGLIFYLPSPNYAANSLTSGAIGKETITCGGFGAGKLSGICKEFQDKGGVPGWREVPCEGICIL